MRIETQLFIHTTLSTVQCNNPRSRRRYDNENRFDYFGIQSFCVHVVVVGCDSDSFREHGEGTLQRIDKYNCDCITKTSDIKYIHFGPLSL